MIDVADVFQFRLPGGLHGSDGACHRAAELRPLSGREEEKLADSATSAAEQMTALLVACVSRIGDASPVTTETARQLCVGDRLFLLLRLREVTYGPEVQGVIHCPWTGCGDKIDIDFLLSDVPVKECDDEPLHELILHRAGDLRNEQVRFRLPNGFDQECLAGRLSANPARTLRELLGRCVVAVDGEPPTEAWLDALDPRARAEIEEAMAEVAPGPLLRMLSECPECQRSFSIPFDMQDFFFGELRTSPELLYREVHYLAFHYHWSESDILDMTRQRRHRYIDVLADEIDRMNNALG